MTLNVVSERVDLSVRKLPEADKLKEMIEEGRGDVAEDSTGNGHDGKLVDFEGASWVDGKSGKALMFEGGSERVVVERWDNMDAEAFTVEAWIYPTKLPDGVIEDAANITHIVDHEGPDGWSLVIGDLGLEPIPIIWATDANGWQNANGKTVLEEDRWQHIAGVCNDGTLTVYLNGEEDGTVEYSVPWVRNELGFVIGSYSNDPATRGMNGIIDDVRYSLVAKKKNELGFYQPTAISLKEKLAACWGRLKAEY